MSERDFADYLPSGSGKVSCILGGKSLVYYVLNHCEFRNTGTLSLVPRLQATMHTKRHLQMRAKSILRSKRGLLNHQLDGVTS